MKKYILTGFAAALFFTASQSFAATTLAGPGEVNALNLIYIENSQVDSGGDLEGSLLTEIENRIEILKAEENSKFLLFVSNGAKPMIENSDYGKATDVIAKLYDQSTDPVVSPTKDLDRLRDLMFKEKVSVKDHIHLHYFLTDHCLTTLMTKGLPALTTLFAREVAYNTTFQGKVIDVFIYVSNNSKKLEAKDIEEKLKFSSSMGIKPVVKVHFKVMK